MYETLKKFELNLDKFHEDNIDIGKKSFPFYLMLLNKSIISFQMNEVFVMIGGIYFAPIKR